MKVSVIIPVYNAERYLRKCVDSILCQTLSDIELLLVNDGSLDKSGEICDEYARKDSRVRVFHKENGGVASARQMGMDNAHGEYVIHADPDDWVEPTMLEELYIEAEEKEADVVICDYWINNDCIIKQQPSSLNHLTILQELFQQLHGSFCNKLLRRTCYNKLNMKIHTELLYCEDLAFWAQLFQHTVKTSYLPKAYYHYMQYNDSITKTYMNQAQDNGWKLITILWNNLRNYPNIRKIACSRSSYYIVTDAFLYGKFSTLSFTQRYCKYIPFILINRTISLPKRLLWTRVCLGLYGYYKKRITTR